MESLQTKIVLDSAEVSLTEHKKTINRTFVCSICGKGYGRNSHLKRHIKLHESIGDAVSDLLWPEPQESDNSQSLLDNCSDSATLSGNTKEESVGMENLLNSSGFLDPVMMADVESEYLSDEKSLLSREKSEPQEMKKSKSFICSVCGKGFRRNSHLKRHEKSHKSNSDSVSDRKLGFHNSQSEDETESEKSTIFLDPSLVVDVEYEYSSDEELPTTEKIKHENIDSDVSPSLFIKPVYESNNTTCVSAENDEHPRVSESDVASHSEASKHPRRTGTLPRKSARGRKEISLHEHKMNIIRKFICRICGKGFGRNSHLKRHEKGHAYKGDFGSDLTLSEEQESEKFQSELNGNSSCDPEAQSDDDGKVLEVAVEQLESTSSVSQGKGFSIKNKTKLSPPPPPSPSPNPVEENEPLIVGDLEMGVDIDDLPYADDAERVNKLINEDGRFECLFCHKQYTQEAQYARHLKLHKTLQQFDCDLCGKQFSQKEYLKAHINTVHANKSPLEKIYQCSMCDKSFGRNSHLKRHLKMHIEGKPFSCHICGKRFGQSCNLKGHMKTHIEQESSLAQEGMYKCNMCDKSYGRSSHLTRHMKTHANCKKTTCDMCGLCFARKSDLEYHMKSHFNQDESTEEEGVITTVGIQEITNDYQCKVCGKSFKQLSSLKAHGNTMHGDLKAGEKDFECNFCGKQFGRNSHLKRHMKLHVGGDMFTCDLCGKSFKQNGNLKAHIRMVHLKERSFQCPYCGNKFLQKSNLDIHIRTHTGEKPYECMMCGKDFVQGSQLKYHMRSHLGEKPYMCIVCGKKFSTNRACQKHKRIHEDMAALREDAAALEVADTNGTNDVEDPLGEEIVIVKEELEEVYDEMNDLESSGDMFSTDNLNGEELSDQKDAIHSVHEAIRNMAEKMDED